MSDDDQRYADELARCDRLSLDVTAPAPPQRTAQLQTAKYHAERARVLRLIGQDRAVAFLREEMFRALAGDRPDDRVGRWFRLHFLEFAGPLVGHVTDLMGQGVQKLESEGVADMIAERDRARRAGRLRCPECGNRECDGCL